VGGPVLLTTLCTVPAGLGGETAPVDVVYLLFAAVVAVYAIRQGVIFELLLERTWRHTCQGIGFHGLARSSRGGVKGYLEGDMKVIYPKLREVRGNREAWSAIITPFAGQTVEEYNEHADAFALVYDVPFVSFENAGGALIRMRCGPGARSLRLYTTACVRRCTGDAAKRAYGARYQLPAVLPAG
jgi:hypothetical protein